MYLDFVAPGRAKKATGPLLEEVVEARRLGGSGATGTRGCAVLGLPGVVTQLRTIGKVAR